MITKPDFEAALAADGYVIQANVTVAFQRGEVFSVPAGNLHCEEIGSAGAEICVGRKY